MILEVQIRSFGAGARRAPAHEHQSFHFQKIPGGLNINIFLKIGIKLPFTIKYKRRNTNFKFEFQNYFIFTPEKARFWFLKKNTHKKCFLRVSVLIQL